MTQAGSSTSALQHTALLSRVCLGQQWPTRCLWKPASKVRRSQLSCAITAWYQEYTATELYMEVPLCDFGPYHLTNIHELEMETMNFSVN